MPALSLSSWNISTVTLASAKSKSQGNKLRRRRRPPPLRDMSGEPNGIHNGADVIPPMPTPVTASSATARSISPTLHEKHVSEPRERDTDKDDAQAQVITSLRAQITDLITQVSQLNSKLVKSYDRVSDLEDELHVASQNARTSSLKISNLEIERAQHLAALNTGLYVEKSHVTAELNRLMERATEEAAARGQAESARQNIEKELDDLSASLFAQANTMVAEARLERAMSERKVVEAEMALKSAEEAVGVMQLQMQSIRDEKNRTDDEIAMMRARMEKGKFIEQSPVIGALSVKLLSLHAPYQEFVQFVLHLRSIRHSTVSAPHISTLLPLPFLARLQAEDSDPTVRLDLAPSLNWLSRRSVGSAIHSGQLTIEPMSITTLMAETASGFQSMIAGSQHGIACALCGVHIYPSKPSDGTALPTPTHTSSSLSLGRHGPSNAWSSSLFKNPLSSAAPSPPPTPPREATTPVTPTNPTGGLTTVFVFRVAQPQAPHPPSSYAPAQHGQAQKMTSYPLCASGWCLARLRMTCSLWAFIRVGVVDRVWEEEPAPRPPAPPSLSSASAYSLISIGNNPSIANIADANATQKETAPPLPPRRRSKMTTSVGALWEKASGALRSATPTQSQPASPIRNDGKDREESSEASPKGVLGEAPKVTSESRNVVPPPLPQRNQDQRESKADGVDVEKHKEEGTRDEGHNEVSSVGSSSPTGGPKSTSDAATPVALSRAGSPKLRPTAQHITIANSETSAFSGAGEEFSTPVEELPPAEFPSRPATPRSPRSPHYNKRTSMSPPRSPAPHPKRVSSPPTPHSPRSIPLPDSRPGTPGTPHRTHARRASEGVTITPLNIDPEKTSRPPSRAGAASPRPTVAMTAAAPPPLPRRAAARRAVPPPPGTASSAPPPSTGSVSNDEKETPTQSPVSGPQNGSEAKTEETATSPVSRKSIDTPPAPPPRRSVGLPPPPPRRTGHIAQNSASDFGDKDDGRLEAAQNRQRNEKLQVDQEKGDEKQNGTVAAGPEGEESKNYVGDATWEERTWKEIVRLREDMFWARVGAIRG